MISEIKKMAHFNPPLKQLDTFFPIAKHVENISVIFPLDFLCIKSTKKETWLIFAPPPHITKG